MRGAKRRASQYLYHLKGGAARPGEPIHVKLSGILEL